MHVRELNENQILQLKDRMLCERFAEVGYYELSLSNILITIEEVYEHYEGVEFTEDDFWSWEEYEDYA